MYQTKTTTDNSGIAEKRPNFFRAGICGYIEIFRIQVE